jgi:Fic-DOC domain mobile mystery protein B
MDFRIDAGNTPLDPTEAEGLIPSISTQAELNSAELRNIFAARRWANRNREIESNLLHPATLRLLHKMMFDQTWTWAGKFRMTQKSIGIEAFRISTELKILCDDTRTWIEMESYKKDEIAVRFHHRLILIHAFPNGNGRHARLATDLLCAKLEILAFTWGSGLPYNEVRATYISALQEADRHDLQPLIAFVRS